MHSFKPSYPFNVPAYILKPLGTKNVKGVLVKMYPTPEEGELIFCSYKTYGGTEQNNNGQYSVIDTGNVETWFRPDITADCRFCLADNPTAIYEIVGRPENINKSNQWLKFKVQAVSGGA